MVARHWRPPEAGRLHRGKATAFLGFCSSLAMLTEQMRERFHRGTAMALLTKTLQSRGQHCTIDGGIERQEFACDRGHRGQHPHQRAFLHHILVFGERRLRQA